MKTFNHYYYYILLPLFFFNGSSLAEGGKGLSSAGSKSAASLSIEKGSLADLLAMNENRQTLADLIAAEDAKEKENPSTNRKGKTLTELFNDTGDFGFGQFLCEIRENELLIGNVFKTDQNVQINQLKLESKSSNKDKLEGIKQQTEEQLEKKLHNLNSMKQKDPVMSRIMESLATFSKLLKSGNQSDILMENLRSLLFSSIEICAKREKIPMSEIKTNEKFGIKSFAKLIKLLMEEKSEKNKQKKNKKDEKSKEKKKLRLMYTAVDNLNITANIENKPDKENKMIRRKKRFGALDFCTDLVMSLMITYIIHQIDTWLRNRGYTPIFDNGANWIKNALINFHQKRVLKAVKEAINTIPAHTFEGDGSGNGPNNGLTGCPICLDAYKTGEKVRTLPCNKKHQFHSECVDRWIEKQNNCPLCRAKVFNVNLINIKAELNNTGQPNEMPAATENAQILDNATTENM